MTPHLMKGRSYCQIATLPRLGGLRLVPYKILPIRKRCSAVLLELSKLTQTAIIIRTHKIQGLYTRRWRVSEPPYVNGCAGSGEMRPTYPELPGIL